MKAPKTLDTALLTDTDTIPPLDPPPADEAAIRSFLLSKPGTYGWQTTSDKITLDFLPDGRLHIQGPDGEATMWEGSWELEGNILTMDRPDIGGKRMVGVAPEGDNLILGDHLYTRYRP